MKSKIIISVLIVVFLISGYGIYQLGVKTGKETVNTVSQVKPAEKKPLYWHDPMVPGHKFDKPGKSPFMDMELVPVYSDDKGDDGSTVTINSRVQQNLGIRTAEVTKGKLESNLVAIGNIAYNERDVALVQARSNGFVEHVYVRAPLDPVKKGQALAELYVPEWIAAQEEYLTVKHMQGSDINSIVDGALQRMRLAGMSDDQISKVIASGKVHPRITIVAPLNGVVTELLARDGMTVTLGAMLFRINGLNTVWVNAEIPENNIAQVRPGNIVKATVSAFPGVVFNGRVNAVLPEVNATTRTLKARIELSNPDHELVPGMFATIQFMPDQNKEDVLLIPSEAVIQTGTRHVVMVAQANGIFMPVNIVIGNEVNGQTEVKKGLEVGQKVVVSGQFLIDSEASLKGTTTRMSETSGEVNHSGAMK